MKKLLIALLALVPLCAYAQQGSMSEIPDCSLGYCSGLGVPGFNCNRGQRYVQVDNPGVNYSCTGIPSHWVQDAGGSGSTVSLTTTGNNGAATLTGTVLNIPVYQGVLTLTTAGSSGAATLIGATLNIPQYTGAVSSLTTTGTSGAATLSGGALNIPQYQGALTLTTTGSSGAATLSGNTLNIPQYGGGTGSGTVNSGTINHVAYYPATAAAVSSDPTLIDTGTSLSYTGTGGFNATGPISTGTTPPTACSPATGCFAATEGSTAAIPTSGQCFMQADATTHTWKWSCNGGTSISIGANRQLSCQPGLGDGTNAIPAGTYLTTTCKNETGFTWTLSAIRCITDVGSSTCNVMNGAGTALLTGAITGTSTYASGTQSGTTTIASGDYLKITYVADGTTKQIGIDVAGTY